jgi:hypothetical protein
MDVIICDLTADNASVNEVKRRAEAFRTQHPNGTVHSAGNYRGNVLAGVASAVYGLNLR